MLSATIILAALSSVAAECPNACSAHGKCGAYDMCTCYRNWMANDCSERVCQFGLAHVDTPKGDLDASSGQLTGPATGVVENSFMYPAGTAEQFPNMVNSDQTVLTNTAHYYMECSNKGICDRQSGNCQCFEGYGGSACQRAECPDTGNGVCSGHGTCENIKTISAWDGGNIYKLWDEQATMGCVCDGGYQGANCEEKICKYGADPLYQDSFQTIRYANWTYSIYTMDSSATVSGNYSLVFTDSAGEDWQTAAIDIAAGCTTAGSVKGVIESLEELPNNVIPSDSVLCHKWAADTVIHDSTTTVYEPVNTHQISMTTKFTLAFPSNPGMLKDLQINTNLDGSRTTLHTDESTSTLDWFIYSNGFYGENDDYVPDLCTGVLATVVAAQASTADVYNYLGGLDTTELKLLKQCLGDGDGDATNNVVADVENWDTGDAANPHLIKLVDATQDDLQYTDADPTHFIPKKVQEAHQCKKSEIDAAGFSAAGSFCDRLNPPGFYAAIYWDGSKFRILGRPAEDYGTTTNFHVYTTTGYLTRVSAITQAFTTWNRPNYLTSQVGNLLTNKIYTHRKSGQTRDGVDCETWDEADTATGTCLNKGDLMMVLNTGMSYAAAATVKTTAQHASAAIYPQIYTVKKISVEPIPYAEWATSNPTTYDWTTDALTPTFVRHQIVTDKAINVGGHLDTVTANDDTSHTLYKFTAPTDKYNYAAPCANRGICDHNTGLCQCFGGFTNDNCDTIDALAA